MGGTDTRGYLGARVCLKVLGLLGRGGDGQWPGWGLRIFAMLLAVRCRDFSLIRTCRLYALCRDSIVVYPTYLWNVGEKRFFKSLTLPPPFLTALAAFVALAFASSVIRWGE